MEKITLGNGAVVVEVECEEATSYEDLAEAVRHQLGCEISLSDEVKSEAGRLRYPVVG